jgi:asparagine synthase (glutamine-hydrolysing)
MAKAENRFTLSGLKDYKLEGLVNYQSSCDCQVNKEFDNLLTFSNSYLGESAFVKDKDSYFSILIGGNNRDQAKSPLLTNLTLHEEWAADDFVRHIQKSETLPCIGIWIDDASGNVYLFREVFGSIPLFYIHVPGSFFAFSASISDLLNHPLVRNYIEINVSKVVSYSIGGQVGFDDISDTFFSHIKAALPGHLLTVSKDKVVSRAQSVFHPEKWAHLKTPEDYSEEVHARFRSSVSQSAYHSKILGSHLSGGLDSSSVVSMSRYLFPERAIHTFYLHSQSKDSDESTYANLVSNAINSYHHVVNPPTNDLELLLLSTGLYGQPDTSFLSPASNLFVIASARDQGCDVLLSGHGGDAVIGNGFEHITHAFNQRNWEVVEKSLRKRVSYFPLRHNYPNWDSFHFEKKYEIVLNNFLYRRFSKLRGHGLTHLAKLYAEVSGGLGISHNYFLKRALKNYILRLVKQNVKPESSLCHREILNAANPQGENLDYTAALRENLSENHKEVLNEVFHPYVIRGQEESFALSNYYKVSNRSPFQNKDLIELSMAVPNEIKFGDGIGRAHLRQAMKGILPEEIRLRGSKATMSSSDGEVITRRLLNQSQDFLQEGMAVWDYFDRKKYAKQVEILMNPKIPYFQKTATYFHITRSISLSLWLEWVKAQKKGH